MRESFPLFCFKKKEDILFYFCVFFDLGSFFLSSFEFCETQSQGKEPGFYQNENSSGKKPKVESVLCKF